MTPQQMRVKGNQIGDALLRSIAYDINSMGDTEEGRQLIAVSVASFIQAIKKTAIGFDDFDARVVAVLALQ